jgi:hypothetical protein
LSDCIACVPGFHPHPIKKEEEEEERKEENYTLCWIDSALPIPVHSDCNRLFEDIIKLRWGNTELGVSTKSNLTNFDKKRETRHRDRHRQQRPYRDYSDAA